MQKYLFLNWQAVVVVVISLLGFSVTASSQQTTTTASAGYRTSLTIRAANRTVKVGSPVWVDVTEANNSDQMVAVGRERPQNMDQGGESFRVDVWNSKGLRPPETAFYRKILGHLTPEEKANFSASDLRTSSGIAMFLKPGTSITDRIDIGRLYDLSIPGAYTIQVQLPGGSNKITVNITP